MSFQGLHSLCMIDYFDGSYVAFAEEWKSKREALILNIDDLSSLVDAFKSRKQSSYEHNPEITLVDQAPAVRLANACESVSNLVYSMAELAARFANRLSQEFPRSFNALRKKVRKGELSPEVSAAMGDLQWYEKVREIRTEWAHFSSPFVGLHGDEPSIVVRSFRSKDDRVQFTGQVSFQVDDLCQWAQASLRTIDGLAHYLLIHHLIPKFDTERVITQPRCDSNGWPIIKNGIIESEQMTIADYMFRRKILERCAELETWSKELSIPVEVLRSAMSSVTGITGHRGDGTVAVNGYYRQSDVQKACGHLIKIVIDPAGGKPTEKMEAIK